MIFDLYSGDAISEIRNQSTFLIRNSKDEELVFIRNNIKISTLMNDNHLKKFLSFLDRAINDNQYIELRQSGIKYSFNDIKEDCRIFCITNKYLKLELIIYCDVIPSLKKFLSEVK